MVKASLILNASSVLLVLVLILSILAIAAITGFTEICGPFAYCLPMDNLQQDVSIEGKYFD